MALTLLLLFVILASALAARAAMPRHPGLGAMALVAAAFLMALTWFLLKGSS